jgi:hypothetical protein
MSICFLSEMLVLANSEGSPAQRCYPALFLLKLGESGGVFGAIILFDNRFFLFPL